MQLQLSIELHCEHLERDQTTVADGAFFGVAAAILGRENGVTPPHAAGHWSGAGPAEGAGNALDPVGIACDDDGGARRRSGRNGKLWRRWALVRLGHGDRAEAGDGPSGGRMRVAGHVAEEGGNRLDRRGGRARGATDGRVFAENRDRLEREGVNGHASMYPSWKMRL